MFLTSGRGIVFMESGSGKLKDPLAKLTFAAAPTAIQLSSYTASHQQLDCLVGFTTGDIFWFGESTLLVIAL